MSRQHKLFVMVATAAFAAPGLAETNADGRPIILNLASGRRVRGTLVSADAEHVTIVRDGEQRRYAADELEPVSIYYAWRRMVDSDSADAHVELGKYCLANDLRTLARLEFRRAVRIDPALEGVLDELLADEETPADPSSDPDPPEPRRPDKVRPVDPQIARRHREKADAWARKAHDEITSALHLVETEHYLIYSAWGRSNDKPLRKIFERLYDELSGQFGLEEDAKIWAGKLPVYVFWETEHFRAFARGIDESAKRMPRILQAGGYCAQQGSFTYVVLNAVRDRTTFYEVLVHETTHAFLDRYVSDRGLPRWVHEGVAERMAAELVPKSHAARRYVEATKTALRRRRDIRPVFRDVPMDAEGFWYGVAQSLVRYLIARDRQAFAAFVELIKGGTSEAEALDESFGLTHEQLAEAWRKSAAQALR